MNRTGPRKTHFAAARGEAPGKARGGAFTLVELLTVILIIGLLVAILAPSVSKYRALILVKMSQTTINHLELGCNLYKNDFGDYPPSADPGGLGGGPANPGRSSGWKGSQLLALFLIGYADSGGANGQPTADLSTGDGCNGPGFRVETRGKIYGPYNGADRLPMTSQFMSPATGTAVSIRPYFTDAFGNPILYYRFTGTNYNVADNGYKAYTGSDAQDLAQGDMPTPGPTHKMSGYSSSGIIDDYAKNFGVGGSYYRRTDFLLISAGPDGAFLDGAAANPHTGVDSSNDVTNMFPNK